MNSKVDAINMKAADRDNKSMQNRGDTTTGGTGSYAAMMCCLLLIMVAGWPGFVAHGQSGNESEVRIVINGKHEPALDSLSGQSDLSELAASAMDTLHEKGHYLAKIYEVDVDSTTNPPVTTIRIGSGPAMSIGRLEIQGLDAELKQLLLPEISTTKGEVLRQNVLVADIDRMLVLLEAEGHPLAQITVEELQIQEDSDSSLALTLKVDKGEELIFGGIRLEEDVRTRPAFLARVVGLQEGDVLHSFDPRQLQEDLQATELFSSVGEPAVEVQDGRAFLHLPLEEERPGVFDLAVGYQPDAQGRGSIVGSGHIQLSNPFGGGRSTSFRLDQRPGSISQIEVAARDPYIMNTPFSLGIAFKGRQQDSTYNQQTYRIEAGYNLRRFLDVRLSAERTMTQPGIAAEQPHAPRGVSRASRNLFGAGISYLTTRQRIAPRRGYQLDLHAARGFQQRRVNLPEGGATVETIPQEMISGRLRAFFSPWARHVIAVGAEGEALISKTYDDADLIRLGGARSLRGYDEEHFAGWVASRMLAEYRYMTGVRSYVYLFSDLGYIRETDRRAGSGAHRFLPGFGAGAQFETAIGIFTVAYAMNDQDTFMDGRLHLQLSIGL